MDMDRLLHRECRDVPARPPSPSPLGYLPPNSLPLGRGAEPSEGDSSGVDPPSLPDSCAHSIESNFIPLFDPYLTRKLRRLGTSSSGPTRASFRESSWFGERALDNFVDLRRPGVLGWRMSGRLRCRIGCASPSLLYFSPSIALDECAGVWRCASSELRRKERRKEAVTLRHPSAMLRRTARFMSITADGDRKDDPGLRSRSSLMVHGCAAWGG
mmetsp:Transcript_37174/g.80931  ORF Transcript_37174/g.80931 Transcript_37174/m.80931 type:complete len:214 (+) Transcript_37174:407-1048(+)